MSYPLEIQSLSKTYLRTGLPPLNAVKEVSFTVGPGEIFGLLGPNGAGKTTLISMITTLESPTSGDIRILGKSVLKSPRWTKSQMGIVPQELITQGFFNLLEILRFHSGYYGVRKNQDYIEFLLKRLGLWEHRLKQMKQLSGGMKRRLMIAKALVHRPKLVLLDEPTAGVDIELRASLWEFVQELQSQGTSILLTTHYLQEAEALCKRVGIIHKGSLRYLGETQSIIRNLTKRRVELKLTQEKLNLSQMPKDAALISHSGNQYCFSLPSSMSVGELLVSLQIKSEWLIDLKTQEGSLEEAFLNVVHEEAV